MKIGIHGLDARAAAIGRLLADGGYDVRSDAAGADAPGCDILIFAGSRGGTAETLDQLGRIFTGTVVVDAMEGMPSLFSRRVVRALIAAPRSGASIVLSGSNAEAVQLVGKVFRTAGYAVTECDPLAVSFGWYLAPRVDSNTRSGRDPPVIR